MKSSTRYIDLGTSQELPASDPRTMATKEERIAAAQAEQAAFEQRQDFYASVRAIEALCPFCKQPQSAPSCEKREHWG